MKLENIAEAQATVPYIQEWFGVWLIESNYGAQLHRMIENLDLVSHMQTRGAATRDNPPVSYRQDIGEISVISLVGTMQRQVSSLGEGCSTTLLRRDIRAASKDPSIKAIMLRINSGGGTFNGTNELASEIAAAKALKPIVASVEDSCCSAAYWAASACSEISMTPTSLAGSLGTYTVVKDSSLEAAQKGIKVLTVKSAGATYKGMGEAGVALSAEDIAEIQRLVDDRNSFFENAVQVNRGFSAEKTRQLFDGRVHPAKDALSMGLVDKIQSSEDAFDELRKKVSREVFGDRGPGKPAAPKQQAAQPALQSTAPSSYEAAVQALFDMGMTTQKARAQVATKHPELHQEYLDRINQEHSEQIAAQRSSTKPEQAGYWQKVAEFQASGMTRGAAMQHVNKHFPALRDEVSGQQQQEQQAAPIGDYWSFVREKMKDGMTRAEAMRIANQNEALRQTV